MRLISYAQNFEDVMLWRALGHVENGFYIDIGAQDPVLLSTSLAFYERGWRGVNIEPVAAYADLLRARRPDEEVLQTAVGTSSNQLLTFYEIPDTGLSTANAEIAEAHKRSGYRILERIVPVVALDAILEKYSGRDVHWLKIDVEGFERDVLASWTSTMPLPWIVLVESTAPLTTTDTSAQWESLLIAKGYQHVYFDGLNRFYVAPGHEELRDAFRSPPNVFDDFALTRNSTFAQKLASDIFNLEHQVTENVASAGAQRERALSLETHLSEAKGQLARVSAEFAALAAELAERQVRHEALSDRLLDMQSHHDKQAAELLSMQREVTVLTREITVATAEVAQLRARSSELEVRVDRARGGEASARAMYDSIRNSRSWRLTAPLRLLGKWARAIVAMVRGLPRTLAKPMLRRALGYVRADPARKQRVARLLRLTGPLDARLRRFAAANASGSALPYAEVGGFTETPNSGNRSVTHAPDESLLDGGAGSTSIVEALHRSTSRWPLGVRRDV